MKLIKQFFQRKTAVIAVILIILTTGCNSSLRFATVKYDAAQINYLLDSSSMTNLIFQFKSENGGNYKKPFSLISYAYNDSVIIGATPYTLAVVEHKEFTKFSSKIVLGNMGASKSDILSVVTDSVSHMRVPFDYIQFTPKLDVTDGHVYYDMSANVNKQDSSMAKSATASKPTQPCPPAICRKN